MTQTTTDNTIEEVNPTYYAFLQSAIDIIII